MSSLFTLRPTDDRWTADIDVSDVETTALGDRFRRDVPFRADYTLRLGSFADFARCLSALDPALTDETIRQMIHDQQSQRVLVGLGEK
jgi:hypothetical protein